MLSLDKSPSVTPRFEFPPAVNWSSATNSECRHELARVSHKTAGAGAWVSVGKWRAGHHRLTRSRHVTSRVTFPFTPSLHHRTVLVLHRIAPFPKGHSIWARFMVTTMIIFRYKRTLEANEQERHGSAERMWMYHAKAHAEVLRSITILPRHLEHEHFL